MQNQRTASIADPRSVPKNYTIQSRLGEGGYGLVYKATQISTGQNVAIKMLKLNQELTEQKRNYQMARFERETQLCAELNHPHIVQLLDKGVSEDGTPYAVFEYVHGETLKEYLAQKGGLSAIETGELMGQVLDALASAHSQGIVHRDLKPHNIMVTQTGSKPHIKILDFGIGAFTKEFRKNDYQSLTLTREVVGTPSHSAPEQLRGEPATVKSDLYAWGLITIECLTGEPVMKGDSVAEIFQQQLNASNVPLPSGIAGHPLADLLRRVLHKNVRQRAGEADSIYQDFKQVNFNSLVGKIATVRPSTSADNTLANDFSWQDRASEKRQITILCFKLSLWEVGEASHDMETLDTIRKHQLDLCKDVAVRFGGHVAGSLANHVSVYFGYPKVSDNDARRAGRTALEINTQIRRRSALLNKQQGIRMEIRMGMHTGTVLTKPNQNPEGTVPNTAFNLLYSSPPGSILVSDASRKLLDPFLEFETSTIESHAYLELPSKVFTITGERQTEALSFLRPWSANREMIGRETERNQVVQYWEKAKAGTSQAVTLHGQAGIGKSKMVYELKKQVRADGFLFRECRCLPEHQNNALYPFLSMLRNHWGIAELSSSEAIVQQLRLQLQAANCNLEDGLPLLCVWLSVPLSEGMEIPALPPDAQRQVLFNLLYQSIVHIGRGRPFLLVLEDLHWLDPTSQEFVEFLLKKLGDQAHLLLMTTRPAFVPEWSQENLFDLHLAPLDQEATESLAKGVLQGQPIEEKALAYLHERADGIPLYIEELTRMLIEDKFLIQQAGTYVLNTETDVQDIPMTLHDLLNARLDRLGPAKESAQLAAVIGREFTYALLVKASLRDEASIQTDLQALMDMDLVYRQRRVQDESYIFRHALIRDAAYEGMVGTNRKESHLRVAETLEREFPVVVEENPFEVARHLARADRYEEASKYGMVQIANQVEKATNIEALATRETMLNWVHSLKDEVKKIESELVLNDSILPALMTINGYGSEEVEEVINRNEYLVDHARENNIHLNEEVTAEISNKIEFGRFLRKHMGGQRKLAAQIAYRLLDQVKQKPNKDMELGILPMIIQAFFAEGKLEKCINLCQRIITLYDKSTDLEIGIKHNMDPYAAACFQLASIYLQKGTLDKGIEFIQEAVEHSMEIDHPVSIVLSFTLQAQNAFLMQDKKRLQDCIEKYESSINNIKETASWIGVHINMIKTYLTGDIPFGEKYVEDILASGQHYALSLYTPILGINYSNSGEFDKAIDLLQSSIQRSDHDGEKWGNPFVRIALGQAYLGKGFEFHEKAKEQFQISLQESEAMGAFWPNICCLAEYGELLLGEGKGQELIPRFEMALPRISGGDGNPVYLKAQRVFVAIQTPLPTQYQG